MTAPGRLHFVVPEGIDDPARPSGGNAYDRRLGLELVARGWSVHLRAVPGRWPWPDEAARAALRSALADTPDGVVTLVDGLLASAVPDVIMPAARRLTLVVLLHMPLGDHSSEAAAVEEAVLCAAAATVTTSEWTRRWVLRTYPLDPARVRAAPPGVDLAGPAVGSGAGRDLLCVASVTPVKGLDVLVRALARVADLPWHCRCAGAVVRAPGFVADLTRLIDAWGLRGRVVLTGPLTGPALEQAYAAADLLVLPSRRESFGMVVTEALARSTPVIGTDVGGVPEALGLTGDGRCPGLLVPAGDATALSAALRRWLTDASLRDDLRSAAAARRHDLRGWPETAEQVADVLLEVAA